MTRRKDLSSHDDDGTSLRRGDGSGGGVAKKKGDTDSGPGRRPRRRRAALFPIAGVVEDEGPDGVVRGASSSQPRISPSGEEVGGLLERGGEAVVELVQVTPLDVGGRPHTGAAAVGDVALEAVDGGGEFVRGEERQGVVRGARRLAGAFECEGVAARGPKALEGGSGGVALAARVCEAAAQEDAGVAAGGGLQRQSGDGSPFFESAAFGSHS
mmetsp:Transcript_25633/g.78859  ORF Transcript_25633/g.78859 Transcript_25633/m.78859 type:complete len:213 (+) Transcript_25633:78-716(+)